MTTNEMSSSNLTDDSSAKIMVKKIATSCCWDAQQLHVCSQCCRKFDENSDPKLVNCLHSVCTSCVANLVEGSKCNLCQATISPSLARSNMFFHKKNADNKLPNGRENDKISKINRINIDNCSTPAECGGCNDKKPLPAFCRDCGPICAMCQQYHGKIKQLKSHVIEKRNPAKEKSIKFVQHITACPTHREDVACKYCELCKEIICSSCAAETHDQHEISDLNSDSCSLKKCLKSSFSEILATVNDRKSSVDLILDSCKSMLMNMEENEVRHLNKISEFDREMKQYVSMVTENATEKVKLNFDFKRQKISRIQNQLEVMRKQLHFKNEFIDDIFATDFLIGVSKAKNYILDRMREEVTSLPEDLPAPEPDLNVIIEPEYFDGKFFVRNLFQFLETEATKQKPLFQIFRNCIEKHVIERIKNNNNNYHHHDVMTRCKTESKNEILSPDKLSPQKRVMVPTIPKTPPTATVSDPRLKKIKLSPEQSPQVSSAPLPTLTKMIPRVAKLATPAKESLPVSRIKTPPPVIPMIPLSRSVPPGDVAEFDILAPSSSQLPPPAVIPLTMQRRRVSELATQLQSHVPPTVTCWICMVPSLPQNLITCAQCKCHYHGHCHIPAVAGCVQPNWTCIQCAREVRFQVGSLEISGELNMIQRLCCSRILLSAISRINMILSSNASRINISNNSLSVCEDFFKIKSSLWPARSNHQSDLIQLRNIFDFHYSVKCVLETYRQSLEYIHEWKIIEGFVFDAFEFEFPDFHRLLDEYERPRSTMVRNCGGGDVNPVYNYRMY